MGTKEPSLPTLNSPTLDHGLKSILLAHTCGTGLKTNVFLAGSHADGTFHPEKLVPDPDPNEADRTEASCGL